MNRVIPTPLLSLGLFAMWLILVRTIEPGQLLLGLIVAIAAPLLLQRLRPRAGPLRHPLVLARLLLRVGADVILTGIEVAYGIVNMGWRQPEGRFVRVPLALRDEHALAALAMITAVIPGTVWTELAADRSGVLLHVFNLKEADTEQFVRRFKLRYEQALKEVFE